VATDSGAEQTRLRSTHSSGLTNQQQIIRPGTDKMRSRNTIMFALLTGIMTGLLLSPSFWTSANAHQDPLDRLKIIEKRVDNLESSRSQFESNIRASTDARVSSVLEVTKSLIKTASDNTAVRLTTFDTQLTNLHDQVQQIDTNVRGRLSTLETTTVPPIGAVVAFGVDRHNVPSGWLICDGHEEPKAEYPLLAQMLGVPSDATSFHVPDLKGRFLRGLDETGRIDPDGADRTVRSLQADSYKQHRHSIIDNEFGGQAMWADGRIVQSTTAGFHNAITGSHGDVNATTGDATGEGIGVETRPKNIAVYFMIRGK
jgi:microcystin-dependent protein